MQLWRQRSQSTGCHIRRYLPGLADTGDTAAAQALDTSKSRLSQVVSRLEKELGVTLLQRTTRRISLTGVGDAFYQQCLEWHASSCLLCRNGHVMKQAALQGTAFTILPRIYLQADIERGTLVQLLADWSLKPAILSLVYPQHRYRLRRVDLLVDFLTEELRKPIQLPQPQGY